jgi:3-oxoacyl-[acyl-carrier-protein] synthase-3
MINSPYARITGWGMYAPERVVTNDDLSQIVDTSDEWIFSRTGIRSRHLVSGERESTLSLAVRAAWDALRVAGLSPTQLDLIIVATITPEYLLPSTASLVQDALGASHAGAFDLVAGCTGFIYALSLGTDHIRAGSAQHVLVIGAETLSRIVDWTDRDTCVLFGDGAGAVVLSACEERSGVIAADLGSDGSGGDLLIQPAGGSRQPATHESVTKGDHFVKMNGRQVFRFATRAMARATSEIVEQAGWELHDVNLIIPHQANIRIIQSAAKRLELPEERFYLNLERYGNTSAASIPIALCEAVNRGWIKAGHRLVLVGFGAGLTWGAAALEWGLPLPLPAPTWMQRAGLAIRFPYASVRSALLRWGRSVLSWVLGPVGNEDWRGRFRRRIEDWREGISEKRLGPEEPGQLPPPDEEPPADR